MSILSLLTMNKDNNTMIKVEQTAKTLDEELLTSKIKKTSAKKDYERCSTQNGQKELTGYSKEQVEQCNNKTKISQVKSTLRLYKIRVFCFIAKEDFKHFKKVIY